MEEVRLSEVKLFVMVSGRLCKVMLGVLAQLAVKIASCSAARTGFVVKVSY